MRHVADLVVTLSLGDSKREGVVDEAMAKAATSLVVVSSSSLSSPDIYSSLTTNTLEGSFLLGLNWERQSELMDNFSSRSHIRNITRAFKEAGTEIVRSVGELEAERATLDADIGRKKGAVQDFKVLEDYEDLQKRLAEIDTRMHGLINDNHTDGQLKQYYKRSSRELPKESANRPLEILRDAGAVFSPDGLRSVKEVVDFHATVYRNRREFLASEIVRLEGEIGARTKLIAMLSGEKTDILRLLAGAGALDDLIELQRGYMDLIARREGLLAQIAERRKYEKA